MGRVVSEQRYAGALVVPQLEVQKLYAVGECSVKILSLYGGRSLSRVSRITCDVCARILTTY